MRTGAAIVAAGLCFAREARGERPVRIDYQAHRGCPGAEVLVEEITWRTPLARVAGPGDEALDVRVRIDKRGGNSRGDLQMGRGKDRIARRISGPSCDEVVSALGLVVALGIDPRASTSKKRPPPPPPPSPPPRAPVPFTLPAQPPPPPLPRPTPPEIIGDPLPAMPLTLEHPRRWRLGARASTAIGPAPRPLFGGGILAARVLDPRLGASLRLGAEVAATGTFDEGPGAASFLRVLGRVEGCVFTLRPASWLSLVPCVGAEAGMLRGAGVPRGSITSVEAATVPWVALALLPEVAFHAGALSIEIQGGPVFPLVRRQFVFESPDYQVHDVPPIAGAVSLGASIAFP